jgi:catalytic LigB subunit of aromatic ring-opening dioxygenase
MGRALIRAFPGATRRGLLGVETALARELRHARFGHRRWCADPDRQTVQLLEKSFLGPEAKWLPIPEVYLPGSPDVAGHIMKEMVSAGFDPALSYNLKLDRGFVTVYYELESMVSLPMVPIILNCATTTPLLMTLRHAYDFGAAVGDAIRSFDRLERVAVIAGGGLSHLFGEPRVDDVEEFDRWFLRRLESQDYDELIALPNDELMEAGNGIGEVRAWMADAEAMRGARAEVLAYEPINPWINRMGVVLFDRATV